MKPFAAVLSSATLLASVALAAPPEAERDAAVVAAVQRAFLAPLERRNAERSQFSRAAMPPTATRVRVLIEPQRDPQGAEFVSFAVDTQRFASEWSPAEYTGCVYTASNAVYVKRGDRFRPAARYFAQKPGKPSPSLCRAR
jgi:hypothetical protein